MGGGLFFGVVGFGDVRIAEWEGEGVGGCFVFGRGVEGEGNAVGALVEH